MDEALQVPNQNPITPVPPITTYPAPLPVINSKTPWLLIILMVLLAGLASYFGYRNYELNQQLSTQQSTILVQSSASSTPTLVPSPILDPTADWKTYSNKAIIPITFRYPAELKLVVNEGLLSDKYALIYLDSKEINVPIAYGGDLTPIEIRYPQPGNELDKSLTGTYEQQLANSRGQITPESYKATPLNTSDKSITGTTIDGIRVEGYMGGEPFTSTIINTPDGVIMISYNTGFKQSQISRDLFDRILTTIQFSK